MTKGDEIGFIAGTEVGVMVGAEVGHVQAREFLREIEGVV